MPVHSSVPYPGAGKDLNVCRPMLASELLSLAHADDKSKISIYLFYNICCLSTIGLYLGRRTVLLGLIYTRKSELEQLKEKYCS